MAHKRAARNSGTKLITWTARTAILVAVGSCIPNTGDLTSGTTDCSGSRCGGVASAGGTKGQGGTSQHATGGVIARSGGTNGKGGSSAVSTGGVAKGGSGQGGTNTVATGGKSTGGITSATGGAKTINDPSCAGGAAVDTDSGVPIQRLFGTATADSEETAKNNVASNAIDCDTTTRWCVADRNVGHYWTMDLKTGHVLSRIEIMWEDPYPSIGGSYEYTVSVSDDNAKYNLAIDESTNTSTAQTQSVDFPSGTSGRYVRVTVVGMPPPSDGLVTWASFYEVRVFGQ